MTKKRRPNSNRLREKRRAAAIREDVKKIALRLHKRASTLNFKELETIAQRLHKTAVKLRRSKSQETGGTGARFRD